MTTLLLLCLALPAVLCYGIDQKIVGGSDANIANHKHQLSLRASGTHACSASLITAFKAVTVAHCGGSPLSVYTVLGGTADRNDTTCATCVVRDLTAFIRHPDFVNNPNVGYPNDVAVITFFSIATNENLDFIFLASPSDGSFDGASCTITGWGKTSPSGGMSDILQEGTAPIINNTDCAARWAETPINDGNICIRSPTSTACGGDSGGSLVCDGLLAGVASWGSALCEPPFGIPYVYSRITFFYFWIMQQ
jgi:secreted trypsin-like serine protease